MSLFKFLRRDLFVPIEYIINVNFQNDEVKAQWIRTNVSANIKTEVLYTYARSTRFDLVIIKDLAD